MWIAEVYPEEEWFVRGLPLEEFIDAFSHPRRRAHIDVVESFLERAQIIFLEDACAFRRTVCGRSVQMKPATADAGEVPRFFSEYFRERDFIARQRRREPRDAGGDRRAAGHERRSRRHALRGRREE